MTAAAAPPADFITDALAHWAAVRPDEEALSYGGQRWTWAQWHDRAGRAAGGLAARGIGRGDRVAFCDKNHPACLEVSLGAGLLGAVNAVINWRLAGDELDYVINDCGATVLFTGAELLPAIEAIRDRLPRVIEVIVVGGDGDEYEAFLAGAAPAGRSSEVTGEDPWLVMYSSGTTGRPKGGLLSHRNIAALAAGVTHAFFVPAVISGVFAAGDQAVAAFEALRYLVYGAAPMPLPLLRRALDAWPEMSFVQVYGETEMSGVISTLSPAAHRDASRPERLGSAGTPVAGVELRVADPATGQDVTPGQPGEFWFRSGQRMIGYLNRPGDTAQAITDDGWLRSGDIGHTDDGGFMFISDRIKDMIITGGENVYSPEAERVIAEHPAVAEVAVFGVPDEHWGESVKAAVVLRPGASAAAEEIIAFARGRLAGYKCPRTVDFTGALPRNPTGKVLKRVLRGPYWAGRDRQI